MLSGRRRRLLLKAALVALAAAGCHAAARQPMTARVLPRGASAWTYDYTAARVAQIRRHNETAPPGRRFAYLFPYAGSVQPDRARRAVTVSYHDGAEVAYARALGPGVLMLPIVDGRQDEGEFDGWSDAEYAAAADLVAARILGDPLAAGVQIDIEPFRGGHLPFYEALGARLRAGGKLTTGFLGPDHAEEVLTRMYRACDIVVLSGYDFGLKTPAEYGPALDAALARCHAIAAAAGGRSLCGVPASASWGEHEYRGEVADGACRRQDTGFSQPEWLAAALGACARHEAEETFVGLSFWQLSDPPAGPVPACRRGDQPDYISAAAWRLLAGKED